MGFSMMNQNVFVHSSGSWNEYIFEKVCGLSTTEYINVNSKNPWDLKKSYYLDFKNGRDEFLEEVKFAKKYRYQVAEILDEKYYPLLYKGYATEECSRVCLLNMEHSDLIEPFQGSYFKSVSKHISSLIYPYYSLFSSNFFNFISQSRNFTFFFSKFCHFIFIFILF